MSEITFLVDARETLIKKIDETQIILQSNIAETGGELKLLVNNITELFEKKLRLFESKYIKQSDELDKIKNELNTKKFDESNFNNVSWIKNQDTQIKERDNKIRELEGRIKFLETKASAVVKVAVPLVEEVVVESVVKPVVEAVVESVVELEPEIIIETKAKGKSTSKKEPKVNAKKPIKVKGARESSVQQAEPSRGAEALVVEPIEEVKEVHENSVQQAEPSRGAEALVVEEVNGARESSVQQAEPSRAAEALVVESKSKLKKEPKVTTKKPIKVKKTIESEPVAEPVAEPTIKTVPIKGARGAEALALKPLVLTSNIKDVDLLELDDVNYYKDKLDNVYQITEDEDIGIFLGIYDSSSNKIIPIQ